MKAWVKNNWSFLVLIVGIALWIHIVLKQDEQRLCSSEETAFLECP